MNTAVAPCLHSPTQLLCVCTAFWKLPLSGQCIKPASFPKFVCLFVYFSFQKQGAERCIAFCLGKNSKAKNVFCSLIIHQGKTNLVTEEILCRGCNWDCSPRGTGNHDSLLPHRQKICHISLHHIQISSWHPLLLRLAMFLVSHTTDNPCSVAVWCCMQRKRCLELNFWKSQAVYAWFMSLKLAI